MIDGEKCIQCGACERVCACSKDPEQRACIRVYAAAVKNREVLQKAASGGVFGAIAHGIIEAGGTVFGCSMEFRDGVLTPLHIGVDRHEDVVKLQGSKYVQSLLGDTFPRIRQMLREGKLVLFSGTPCQVDSLKRFVKGVDTGRLYTMDLICHGVPSAALFQAYIRTLEKKHGGALTSFKFRDKTRGWGLDAAYRIKKKNGAEHTRRMSAGLSSYYSYFLESEIYRTGCYSCRYAGPTRVGDLTIGDFWGIEQEHPEFLKENGGCFDVSGGISVVLMNTIRGEELLNCFGTDLELRESSLESAARWNRQLREPGRYTGCRHRLTDAYQKKGYCGIEGIFRRKLGIKYHVRLLRQWYQEWKHRG